MQIKGRNNTILYINADSENATLNVSVGDSEVVALDIDIVNKLLPSLKQVKDALDEIVLNKQKERLDTLKLQRANLNTEIENIEKLIK